jgi:hypothetical protein
VLKEAAEPVINPETPKKQREVKGFLKGYEKQVGKKKVAVQR